MGWTKFNLCMNELVDVMERLKLLKVLVLRGNDLGSGFVIEPIKTAPQALEKLDLSNSGLTDYDSDELQQLVETLPSLRELILSNNGLGSHSVEALSETFREITFPLRVLDLSCNKLCSSDVQCLMESLEDNFELEELNLASNEIGRHGMREIERFICKFLNKLLR